MPSSRAVSWGIAGLLWILGGPWRPAWGGDGAGADAAVAAGEAALRAGDRAKAMASFQRALDENPERADALYGMGEAQEGQGQADLAIGYYEAAAKAADSPDASSAVKKIAQNAARKLRTLDEVGQQLAAVQEKYARDAEKIARDLERKGDLPAAAGAYAILSRVCPRNADLAATYCSLAARLACPEPPPVPSGFRSLLNHVDLEGWEVRGGDWSVREGVLFGQWWGSLVFPERFKSVRLRMRYRTGMPGRADQEPTSLVMHASDRWRTGAAIVLAGRDAGMVRNLSLSNSKYTTGEDKDMHLVKESPFRDKEWMELDVTVKDHSIKVKLNDETIYESAKGSEVKGYDDRNASEFPGFIRIDSRQGAIEIQGIWVKGTGTRKGK